VTVRNFKDSRAKHERLIRALAHEYESKGYYVKADHIGHPHGRPPLIGNHVPDIAAYVKGKLCIIAEAETCDTISDNDTRYQWSDFNESVYSFHVIVPKACLKEAENQARMWGIMVNQWWSLNI